MMKKSIGTAPSTCVLLVCLFLGAMGGASRVVARENPSSWSGSSWWVTAGIGTGSDKYLGSLLVSSNTPHGLFAFRYALNFEGFDFSRNPEETVEDWGLLYGLYVQKNRSAFAVVSGGVAFVRSIRRGALLRRTTFGDDYERIDKVTGGLALQGQVGWTPLPFLGFGLDIPVDVNPERSFIGIQLSAHLGILWPLQKDK